MTGRPGPEERRTPPEELRSFVTRLFARLGMPVGAAATMADPLVWAALRGWTWQGTARIPQYAARLRAGGTRPHSDVVVVAERDAFAVLDAGDTWGHVAGAHAMDMAVAKARDAGVGTVVVRNTTSAGALGYYAARAAGEGLVGLAVNNSAPLLAPWGGRGKVLGNQAFAIACPAGSHPPLVLDSATSTVSFARALELLQRGETLPEGAALDADGRPTVDPAAALEGILLPMGGHRGYALAVMWEVLTGVLAGGDRYSTGVTMPDEYHRPQGVSLFLLAVDPEAALPGGAFGGRAEELVERLQASPPADGVDRVAVPGERSAAVAAERARNGIPLGADLVASLDQLAVELEIGRLGAGDGPTRGE